MNNQEQGLKMKFKRREIELIFNRSRVFATSNDTYAKLLSFEKCLEAFLDYNHPDKELTSCVIEMMALIDIAQIQVAEIKEGRDFDGDGLVGGKEIDLVSLDEAIQRIKAA